MRHDIEPATVYSTELLMNHEEIPFIERGVAPVGGEGSDYLVGLGSNTFTGNGGADLFVVSYGSSAGGALTQNTTTDFTQGEDALGLIGLGVNDTNYDSTLFQQLVGDDLLVCVDRDGSAIAELPVLVATLDGFGDLLDLEFDVLSSSPGVAEDDDDDGDDDPPPPEPEESSGPPPPTS
ncbi:MAG: hypothetical protein IE927_07505 [Rhodobacterales bacterium]|nr:hypothetical protein [Rhodobacterales bacterium]